MPEEIYNKNFYEKDAIANVLWGQAREIAIAENILKHIPKNIMSIIDIGCGDGFVIYSLIKKPGKQVYAFDLSLKRLENCRKQTFSSKLIQGNVLKLPFKDNSFDMVICSEVIEHIPNFRDALKEIIRIAKANVIITVPNEQEPVKLHCPKCNTEFYLSGHINKFSKQEMISIADKISGVDSVMVKGFYTIYSYNKATLRLPAFLRLSLDYLLVNLSVAIPFFKPNFILVTIKKYLEN